MTSPANAKRNLKDIAVFLVATAFTAYVLGGFIAGLVWAKCGDGLLANTLGRVFIGIVMCLLSAIFGGFPPQDFGGGGPPFNAWPYIFGCWLCIIITVYLWAHPSVDDEEDVGG